MKVTLLSKTEHAIKVAFTAIRTCYSPSEQEEVWEHQFDEYAKKDDDHIRLIKQIVNHGHTSTLEHIQFTFAINGVSRSLLAQLTRHRIGFAYSVQSQRYVRLESDSKSGGFDVVVPPSIEENEEAMRKYEEVMESLQKSYDELRDLGIKAEDARYILPNAATTNITMSVNLRAFLDFYSKRNKETHAQWEIADLAERLRDVIVETEPWVSELINAS